MSDELTKQPAESRLYHFVFTNILVSGESITGVTSVTQENLGYISGSTSLTIGSPTFISNTVQVRISGGTEDESYKLTALVTTDASNILELDGLLHIREL